MGVRVVKRDYKTRYEDQENSWFLGNTGDWQKVKFTIEVSIEFNATDRDPVSIDELNNTFEITSGKGWNEFGFYEGMNVNFSYSLEKDTEGDGELNDKNTFTETYEIINIFDNKMIVDKAIITDDFTTIPLNLGRKKIDKVRFYSEDSPEGCNIQYSHIENVNKDNGNLNSIIDSTTTSFTFNSLKTTANGVWKSMEAIGFQSGMSVRSAMIRKLAGNSSNDIYAKWDIVPLNSELLVITDTRFTDPFFLGIKSAAMSVELGDLTPSSYRSQLRVGIDGIVVQGSAPGPNANGIVAQQTFINNVEADTPYSQQYFFNLTARIIETHSLIEGDGSYFQFLVLRYSNGTSYSSAERIVLRRFEELTTLINKELNFTGVVDFTINDSDSYVLAVEFFRPGGYADLSRGVTYVWDSGTVIASNPNQNININSSNLYEIEIQYMISSFFDSLNNFETLTPPSYLLGEGSLTDTLKLEFIPQWNNPNISIKNETNETSKLGNTGWFNENFNQKNNKFTVDSVNYFDENGINVSAIDYFSKTKVVSVISGVQNLDSDTKCTFGFSWIPTDDNDYYQNKYPFHQNLYVQSGDFGESFSLDTLYDDVYIGAGINGASMDVESVRFTKSNDKIVFEAVFCPNSAFFTEFDNKDSSDRNYILYLSVADSKLELNFSDRVTLLADYSSLVKTIKSAGEYPYISNVFLEHPDRENATGTESLKAIIQDDVLCRIPFKIKKEENIDFNSFTFGVEAFNVSTGKSFILDSYSVDVSRSVKDSEGIQQFDVDERRNFILDATNNKNWVKIEKKDSLDTVDFAGFIAFFAFRIRWEDWILNSDAPSEFFNPDKLNNGRNNDWYDYLTNLGWQINFITLINANVDNENIVYKNQWNFDFLDYDQNEKIEKTYNYYRHSDNTLINIGVDPVSNKPLGVILNNEETRIEAIFRILDSGTFDVNNIYCQMTIEIDSGTGSPSMRMLSSAWDSESNNPLKALDSGKRLTFSIDATNKILTASCIVDPDLLENSNRYRITARLGCGTGNDSGANFGLYENLYEDIYE